MEISNQNKNNYSRIRYFHFSYSLKLKQKEVLFENLHNFYKITAGNP